MFDIKQNPKLCVSEFDHNSGVNLTPSMVSFPTNINLGNATANMQVIFENTNGLQAWCPTGAPTETEDFFTNSEGAAKIQITVTVPTATGPQSCQQEARLDFSTDLTRPTVQFISITNGAGYNVGGSVISCGRDTTNPRAYDSRNAQTVLPSLAKEISYVISGSEPGMIFECSSGGVWAPCWTTEWLPAGAQMISFGPEGNVAINQPTRAKLVVRWPDDGIYTLNVDALD